MKATRVPMVDQCIAHGGFKDICGTDEQFVSELKALKAAAAEVDKIKMLYEAHKREDDLRWKNYTEPLFSSEPPRTDSRFPSYHEFEQVLERIDKLEALKADERLHKLETWRKVAE